MSTSLKKSAQLTRFDKAGKIKTSAVAEWRLATPLRKGVMLDGAPRDANSEVVGMRGRLALHTVHKSVLAARTSTPSG